MPQSRRERLGCARLYLVCDAPAVGFLDDVLGAGVDIVQLRAKDAAQDDQRDVALAFREACTRAGALFVVNDHPRLARDVDADGVHLGQDDMPVAAAREIVGLDRLIGLSTHATGQLDRARGVDYVAVGPVQATPTKPGRPPIGLQPVRYAAETARVPWFAIGGIDAGNVSEVLAAGARRVVVVRAIADAEDPVAATRRLADALSRVDEEVRVGTT